jgi:hypothetical protein
VHFVGIGGASSLVLAGVSLTDDTLTDVGSCAPVVSIEVTCVGAQMNVGAWAGSCNGFLAPQPDSDRATPNGVNVPGGDVTSPGAASDALANPCDSNDDNDAISDADEVVYPRSSCPSATGPTSPVRIDTDGDHLTDGWECQSGSDPADRSSIALGVITFLTFGSVEVTMQAEKAPTLTETDVQISWKLPQSIRIGSSRTLTD